MSRYLFHGLTVFLDKAAQRNGRPEAALAARRDPTLSALANLCAQTEAVGPNQARTIMVKATEFRNQLHAALQAADFMIEEVNQALGLVSTPSLVDQHAQLPQTGAPRGRKSPMKSEEHLQR
jgi:hypothetical protein